LASRATTALSNGSSIPIISQLNASGTHVIHTSRMVMG